MQRRPSTLFDRLRRHRGVWVLALAVLLFKVAMSTACVLDGPRVAFAADAGTAVVAIADATDGDGDACLAGEGGGCHCSCAHAVALPSSVSVATFGVPPSPLRAALPDAPTPAFRQSLLRPPIA
ncbi:hypothetical protein SAMN02800692_3008 [Luteibacter sp. UNC138MFCol5.1]|uniref:hypothetical protein n=1 Tax=Luteibacter sp. UNC138MFCol5.1 TaxID=1502774 RepID=UPI0008C3BB02|nr:hypothetical protein [Luteibacter sp. UNC138MFCol5.1]SEO95717.1 hypothetical protein SAMN02800692_3008 [Luteibacter sp. UNC138MFCol5.1]